MSFSETLETMGDLNANVSDEQLLTGGNHDLFKNDYFKRDMTNSGVDSEAVDDFEFANFGHEPASADTHMLQYDHPAPVSDFMHQSPSDLHSSSSQSLSQLQAGHNVMAAMQGSNGGANADANGDSFQYQQQLGQLRDDRQQQQNKMDEDMAQSQLQSPAYMQHQQFNMQNGIPLQSSTLSNHNLSSNSQMQTQSAKKDIMKYKPPFRIDLAMVRKTMDGVNRALGVDLGGTEVGETALMDSPLGSDVNEDGDLKDGSSTKAEMSHVRLISDACGHIVASVGRAVLQAAEESVRENALAGLHNQRPKPPIRKKRGGILGFKELAQRANLSPWHFHRVFRFVTGVTPKAYGEALWEYLMVEAGFDLEHEELTIDLSAKSLGLPGLNSGSNSFSGSGTYANSSASSPSSTTSSAQLNGATSTFRNPSNSATGEPDNSGQQHANGITRNNGNAGGEKPNSQAGSDVNNSSSVVNPNTGLSSASGMSAASNGDSASKPEVTTGSSLTHHQQSIVPLSGPVVPGRVRKASTSRGARSRSRNRTQPQNQVLNGLNIEPGTAEAAASPMTRGRSFSRVAQRPTLITTDQALQGVLPTAPGIQSPVLDTSSLSLQHVITQQAGARQHGSHTPSPMSAPAVPFPSAKLAVPGQDESLPREMRQNGISGAELHPEYMSPEMVAQRQQQSQRLQQPHQQSLYAGGAFGFDIPDLNALSLQHEPPTPSIDSIHHQASSVPDVSPLSTMSYMQPFTQQEPMPSPSFQRNGILKGHNRRQSTGGISQSHPETFSRHQHNYSAYAIPPSQVALPQGYSNSLESNTSSSGHLLNNQNRGDDGIPDQQRFLNQQGTAQRNERGGAPQNAAGGDTLQEDLQREMYDQHQNEEEKNDPLSDLPASFYLSMDDKSLYGDSSNLGLDDFSSALIGADDPPLLPSWNEVDTSDQFPY